VCKLSQPSALREELQLDYMYNSTHPYLRR